MNLQPVIIAGPTGVGKSLFAVELASQLGGEILCADAFQLYAGMSVLTAQPGPDLTARVPHHLFGSVPATDALDAAKFRAMAEAAMAGVAARGRVPVLVGGSGMYLKALTHGLEDIPPADPRRRAELAALSLDELLARLDALDPDARSQIDARNPRRVLRAVEICESTGRPLAASRRSWADAATRPVRGFVLTRERDDLSRRIVANVDEMFRQGVVGEVRALGRVGPTASRAIGWAEIQALLSGETDETTCRRAIVTATTGYAKRQLTWFRNQFNFATIDLTGQTHEISRSALSALSRLGMD